ncbi:MAG TPA: prephenate dehydratase [Acidiferrobacteraceae bacterium]|nr:prephenate dehydratase [Acidiferrobacteraceae bacterium]
MGDNKDLKELRTKIDEIDVQIQSIIEQRGAYALDVARFKEKDGQTTAYYRPEREAQILQRVKDRSQGPIDPQTMARLFREIMSACLALEQPTKVAFLGPSGTYTEDATLKQFGQSVQSVPLGSIDSVFREVERGHAEFAVVPVENSTEGVVSHTLDRMLDSPLKICGEVELSIQHCLMSQAKSLDDLRAVVSHQQSLAQCREWLAANLPNVEIVTVNSNAEAAKQATKDPTLAAIAGINASKIYGLHPLARNIEDHVGNTTRFLVLGNMDVDPSGRDKTSLVLSSQNQSGALYRLLAPLEKNNISMSRIESRPSRQAKWEYVFFIDIEGHVQDKAVANVIKVLEKEADFFKHLGSYPTAVL